ncbi:MAG: hypothetical protein ACJ790_14755, partial [Myxococcaceae bacterium]
ELLMRANVLVESQLKSALAEQQKWGGKLGEILVRMNVITEDILVKALSKQLNIPASNLDAIQGLPPHVKSKVPLETARDLCALPLQVKDEGKTLVVAMAEPQNVQQIDTLRSMSKCRIVPMIAGRTAIQRAFGRFYEGEADLGDFEGSFKVVDSAGRTVVKSLKEIEAQGGSKPAPPVAAAPAPAPVAAPRTASLSDVPNKGKPSAPNTVEGALELLRAVEDVQRKEVAALKAMVELMIEKGIFSRDEYLAKVKR